MTGDRLDPIRRRARRMIADHVTYASVQYAEDYGVLLAEVDRLRAELDRARAEALREAADHFVAHCFTHTPGLHHGYMQCHCEAAAELRALAKEQP